MDCCRLRRGPQIPQTVYTESKKRESISIFGFSTNPTLRVEPRATQRSSGTFQLACAICVEKAAGCM